MGFDKFIFFVLIILLSCSFVSAENVSDDALEFNDYQYDNGSFIEGNDLSDVSDEDGSNYYLDDFENNVDNSYDVDCCSDISDDFVGDTNFDGELFADDIGIVYFDDNVVDYSLVGYDSKFISSRSRDATVSFSVDDIGFAAKSLFNSINSNKRLPARVNVTGVMVDVNDFLYLMCKSLNATENITYVNFNHVSSVSGTNKPGLRLNKSVYKSIGASIVNCYEINGRNPLNLDYNGITINFEDAVYLFATVVRYNYVHGYYVSSASINALTNYDYSTESIALGSNTNSPFTISASCVDNNNGTYNLTLTPSQNAVIYYTRNGTVPTTSSKVYNNTLTIYNSTWVRFFGVNNNGQTPVLSFGVYRASIPYVTRNPVLHSNGYSYKISLSTSQSATIYYTLNGSKPTTQSAVYTSPITVNNYSLLQYFAVTTSNNKQSNIYYYRLNNPTPYVTILNQSEVRDNHQNVTIIANKPGTIYYTRNGSVPTVDSTVYTSGRVMGLSVVTQLRAVLVDTFNQSSFVVFYQAPQIITPPITVIKPVTGLLSNNTQQIQFIINNPNATIYYTTDGSNPFHSNTTKTALNGTIKTIHKTTYLYYYTRDNQGYTSAVYLYRTPRHAEERPEITVFNTTGVYSDGTQRIMIQSNQPGVFNVTIYDGTNNPIELKNIYEELTINKDYNIQIYTQFNGKYSKTIEYNSINGIQTIMNYNYTIQLFNINQYSEIYFYTSVNLYNYLINDNSLNNYVHINLMNYNVNVINSGYMNQPGVTIHKTNNSIEITFYSQMYGETNVVNALLSPGLNTESICLYSNGTRLFDVYWRKNNNETEIINTHFETLSNKFTKNETITYTPKWGVGMCGSYDILQTYILTNEKITSEFYNQSLYNISHYNPLDDLLRITPQDRTITTGLTTLWGYDGYAEYIAYQLNSTAYRSDETLCIVGINYDRVNYVQFNDLKMGMVFQGNSTNEYFFNLHTSTVLPEIARISLNLIRTNLSKTAQTLLMQLSNTSTTHVYTNNLTMIMKIYSPELMNVYLMMNTTSGIISSIIILDGFEYNGAITEPLIQDDENITMRLLDDLEMRSSWYCFEDYCNEISNNQAQSIFDFTCDSNLGIFENLVGSVALGMGVGMFMGTAAIGLAPAIIGGLLIVGGLSLLADSHGILTGTATCEDMASFVLDVGLACFGAELTNMVKLGSTGALNAISKGTKISSGLNDAVHEYRILNAIQKTSQTCIDTTRDLIISYELKHTISNITGWDVN